MEIKNGLITKGFILAGLMNIFGVLIFSRMLNNPVITAYDSETMSSFGLLMIVIWGFAYISVSKNYQHVKWIVGVFAVEKLIYAIIWTIWQFNNNLPEVFEKDTMAGIFYSIYGVNDWIFFFFFLVVFIKLLRLNQQQ